MSFGWAVGEFIPIHTYPCEILTFLSGIGLGAWISGSISGGHINPAVTIAMATLRDFPWRKVPLYILAQFLGGICGAGIVYANYIHAIDAFEGGRNVRTLATAGLFGTFAVGSVLSKYAEKSQSSSILPQADYLTNISAFFEEVICYLHRPSII